MKLHSTHPSNTHPSPRLGGRAALLAIGLILAVSPLAAQRRVLRLPDIPGYTTLKGDFHTHTVFSDGNVWPTVRVQEAWRDGLDALAIADHVEYLPHKDFIPVNHNAAWEICRTLAEEKNIILVHGAELNRDMPPGHLNALFIQDAAALAVPDIMDAIEAAVRQGAFIMYNHPGWEAQERDGIPKLYPIHRDLIAKGRLHGIEYVNTYSRYPLVLDMCRDHRLAIMGDSDAHDVISEIYKASENAHRPVTLVFAKERSSASIREAMFAGRTAVWSGNELAGFENVAAPFFRAAVSVAKPHRADDKSIWFEVGNASDLPFFLTDGPAGAPSSLTIPANGSVIVKAERRYLTEPLAYTAKNVVIGNGKSLAVTLAPGGGPAGPIR
ncbi:MAG: hypothetical protein PHI34_10285 [Acidobacteriota bacterium]|nr:hypothetical protein [Acidobacteriota bacterium]